MNLLELLTEIERDVIAEQQRMYASADPALKALGWIKRPDSDDTRAVEMAAERQYRFSMARVVTGARRKWRKVGR